MAWNAPDDEVVEFTNYFNGPVLQVTGLTFSPPVGEEIGISGILTWDEYESNNLAHFNIYYAFENFEAVNIDTEWIFLGRSSTERFAVPSLDIFDFDDVELVLTVVPEMKGGAVAPQEDWYFGGWPVVQFTPQADPAVLSNLVKLQIFTYAKTDRIDEILAPSGSFNFTTSSFSPPLDFYPSAYEALQANATPEDPGDLYFAESTVDFNLDAISNVVSPITWSSLQLFAPERNIENITVYHRRLPAGATPATPDSGTGGYNFTNKTITVPTGNVTWYSQDNLPDGIGVVFETSALMSRMGNYGDNTNVPLWSTPRLSNATGAQRTTLRLYQWASTAPTFAVGAQTTFDWLDGGHGDPVNLGSWSINLLTNPGGVNVKLWVAERTLESEATATAVNVDWDDGNTNVYTTDAGSVPGGKSATTAIYKWEAGIPAAPTVDSTYTWETASINNVAEIQGWYAEPQAAIAGFTLWRIEVRLNEEISVLTSTVFWSNYSIVAVGASGTQGVDGGAGQAGLAARRAYGKQTSSFVPQNYNPQTVSGDNFPATDQTNSPPDWGGTWIWSGTANITLVSGEAIFQIDGFYDASADQTTWDAPYISSFKVGSLSAISVNTGNLSVNGELTVGPGGVIKSGYTEWQGAAGAGEKGYYIDDGNGGRALIGDYDGNNYLMYDGTNVEIQTPDFSIVNGNTFFSGDVGINNATFEQEGIQLQTNGGNPRSYIGNGIGSYMKFENGILELGPDVNISGTDIISSKTSEYYSSDCSSYVGWDEDYNVNPQWSFEGSPPTDSLLLEIRDNQWTYNTSTFSAGFSHRRAYRKSGVGYVITNAGNTDRQAVGWTGRKKFYLAAYLSSYNENSDPPILEFGMGDLYAGPAVGNLANGISFEVQLKRDLFADQNGLRGKVTNNGNITYTSSITRLNGNDIFDYSVHEFFIDYNYPGGVCDFYVDGEIRDSIILTGLTAPDNSTNKLISKVTMGAISFYGGSGVGTVYIKKIGMWSERI